MFFSLCFFHACVTERRKFGSQGWNHNYPISTGDLTISANILYNYLEANSKVFLPLFFTFFIFIHIVIDINTRLIVFFSFTAFLLPVNLY